MALRERPDEQPGSEIRLVWIVGWVLLVVFVGAVILSLQQIWAAPSTH